MNPVLQRIREAVVRSSSSIPDREVLLDDDKLGKVLDLLFGHRPPTTVYVDVPLSSIVGVHHKDGALHARCWRDLLGELHGHDWTPAQLEYMESEIGEKLFGVNSARGPLHVSSFGGAVISSNGLHRLVGAVCWMAARDGDAASLRKLSVYKKQLTSGVQSILADAANRRSQVSVAAVEVFGTKKCGEVLIKVADPNCAVVQEWVVRGDEVWRAEAGRREKPWWVPTAVGSDDREAGLPPTWHRLPALLVDAIANDDWLCEQLAKPRYVDLPPQRGSSP